MKQIETPKQIAFSERSSPAFGYIQKPELPYHCPAELRHVMCIAHAGLRR